MIIFTALFIMKIIINANSKQQIHFKSVSTNAEIFFVDNNIEIPEDADAFIDLSEDETVLFFEEKIKPVFKSAVRTTANNLPENYIRINGWNGFIEQEKWEVYCKENQKKTVAEILQSINKTPVFTDDTVGFISARTIAMIINEAYFALGENISTKDEIDTAMKLGVNYPAGPFEWSEKIGLEKIKTLLKALHNSDSSRYSIAPLLQ